MAKHLCNKRKEIHDQEWIDIRNDLEIAKYISRVVRTIRALQMGDAFIICRECGKVNYFVGQDLPFICSHCGEVIIAKDWAVPIDTSPE